MKVIYGFLIGAGIIGGIIMLAAAAVTEIVFLTTKLGVFWAFTINAMLLFGAIGAKAAHDGVFDKCRSTSP